MAEFLLDYDPDSKTTKTMMFDDRENRIVIRRHADVSQLIEANKVRQADFFDRLTRGRRARATRMVAEFDPTVGMEWCKQRGIDYQSMIRGENQSVYRAFLNDPDNSWFKCVPGKI